MIYLDHAAATPVIPSTLEAMRPYFSELFFNPSAPYLPAKWVRESYQSAKNSIAHTIGAKGADLVITSGATESINLAFTACQSKPLVLSTEHASVLAAAGLNSASVNTDSTSIKVDKNGLIDLKDFKTKLTDDIDFISISLANNEIGTIQPLSEISGIIREIRQNRLKRGISTPVIFHTDASQALNLIDINVARLGVDLLTLNAAKCGGPKGVGALYVGRNVSLKPISVGGGQERGLRSGTENVPAVMGFAAAATRAQEHLGGARKKYLAMTKVFRQTLLSGPLNAPERQNPAENLSETAKSNPKNGENWPADLPKPLFLGNPKHQLANFCPISFPGIDAERLIYALEQEKIYVSTGAACAANKGTKSHVLTAIGLSDAEIAGSLRISFGATNDESQAKEAALKIRQAVLAEYARLNNTQKPLVQNLQTIKSQNTNGAQNG